MKNIGVPAKNQYLRSLINKTENVVHRMRWKARFFLYGDDGSTRNDYFNLPSNKCAPPMKEMKDFEDDLTNLISSVKFRNVNDPFLKQIGKDMTKVNDSKHIFVFADKSTNIYEMPPDQYKKLLRDNITKSYKTCKNEAYDDINEELRDICNHFSIGNRINTMATKDAFITIKDHKEDFPSNLKCRLINPTKSNLGKVSKVILEEINEKIRAKLDVNQWKNSQTVIEWFQSINDKCNHTFMSFDIVEFYPSITE